MGLEEGEDNVPQQPAQPKQRSVRFYLCIFWLCLVSVMVALDSVIVAAILPIIAEELGGTTNQLFWCGTGFLLAQTVTIPLYGSASDIFGRKWTANFSIALFTFASILCATAKTLQWLVAARAVQGLGAGGVVSLTSVIISDMSTLRERGKFTALIGMAWAIGTIGGVPMGGAMGEKSSWRWAFWINVPVGVIGFLGLVHSLHLKIPETTFRSKMARIDYLGILVFVTSTTSFLFGLTSGGTLYEWSDAGVIAPIVLGAVGWVAFGFIEYRWAREPMIPLRIFWDRTAAVGYTGTFVHALVLWGVSYYIIIFFLGAKQHGLLHAAVETMPGSAPIAMFTIVGGLIASKTLRFQKVTWVGWFLFTTGTGLQALLTPDANNGILYGLRIIAPIGAGLLFSLPLLACLVNQADADIGIATTMQVFARSLGQAFGVAIGGVVFQNQFDHYVTRGLANGDIPPEYIVRGQAADAVYSVIANTFPPHVQRVYQFVYADALRTMWYVLMAIAGVAAVISLASGNDSLDRDGRSRHQFDHGNKEKAAGATANINTNQSEDIESGRAVVVTEGVEMRDKKLRSKEEQLSVGCSSSQGSTVA
ncbi:hypothetical protein AJ80_06770 [Polytolypa hystricis UAMH7299]|uniref:Major facilitator superfamily (MFS) profile domain-containing protein n=1 Tax=Polytolypa hystricis (strain UAMH7299) TaxID=1447883 RepID=A0A2B7XSR8_POLH7|nr:hypothetical protein AJ80_06770 [Polytolypa hystricis UAMH7299]